MSLTLGQEHELNEVERKMRRALSDLATSREALVKNENESLESSIPTWETLLRWDEEDVMEHAESKKRYDDQIARWTAEVDRSQKEFNQAREEFIRVVNKYAPVSSAPVAPSPPYVAHVSTVEAKYPAPQTPVASPESISPVVIAVAKEELKGKFEAPPTVVPLTIQEEEMLGGALSVVLRSEQLTGLYGRIDILRDLADALAEVADNSKVEQRNDLLAYNTRGISDNCEYLRLLGSGQRNVSVRGGLVESLRSVIRKFLIGEEKDLQKLLEVWSRDQDAYLRDKILVFMDSKKWLPTFLAERRCLVEKRLSVNQNRYTTGGLRRVSDILISEHHDASNDVSNAVNLSIKATEDIVSVILC